ncbi:family 78 glycoside hydrolase catalytic domain [Mucilaginibacter sp. JRF]|uniref:family 78 glycoside hydrolase catalytic domain n=1 Tax=Mucilaginibacter sp. JRF TaxID=2780088 RepID=UPI00187F545D|nr:family 78 glycoside hydrolase catalytic domain [Mucilaginibacter sp. JRF]MBE9585947.1 family 78 glycoside hydrolase catalytic domain [Mucilaginibacter sp. JRF]
MMYFKTFGISLTFFCILAINSFAQVKVDDLRCDYSSNPIAVENEHPLLSWQLTSLKGNTIQLGYRIIVASTPALLARRIGDYWDSGKILSRNSTQVSYKGKPMNSRQNVYWAVQVWDDKGQHSGWSKTASWRVGLINASDWKGQWIGQLHDQNPDSASTYPAPYFRKEFKAGKKIKRATAYVCGLGFYELYINGKKIGNHVLAPAVTNYDIRPLKKLLYPYDDQSTQRIFYNTFDVTNNLGKSNNTIGMLLGNGWYNQRDRTVEGYMWYDVPKLIFQLELTFIDGSKKTIVSDSSWKTTVGPLLSDGIFSGEHYDARIDLGAWNKTNYNDNEWRYAFLVKPPSGVLQPQTAPYDKVIRMLRPVFDGRDKGGVYLYHLDETISGWAAIKVNGMTGSQIVIRYISEEGEDYSQVDTYILKGRGKEIWEPKFTWHTFRRIEITAKDVLMDAESLTIKDVHTDVKANGNFECSDTLLNQINRAYLRTQLANFHGSISSDCPHRERLGYTGDGQVAMESALLSFRMEQFYRKWINDIDDARNHKTGFVPHSAPFGGGGGGPAWGAAYVIMPWLYYKYYEDTTMLNHHYAGMKQWVHYLHSRTDDRGIIIREEPGGWCLGDWCTPENIDLPEPLVNTAYFYHCLRTMSKVASLLGKLEDKRAFENMGVEIKKKFNDVYFDNVNKSYWQGRQGSDVFALAFDLVPKADYKAVFNNLVKHLKKMEYHFDTGILATPLLLKVLSENNRDDIALKIMTQKNKPGFGYLLNDKNSMLWEEWSGRGSHAHPMFGSVVSWLYSALGGIKPGKAGLQHFTISPQPVGNLKYCKTSYNSSYGRIRSEWKKSKNGQLTILIEIPVNTTADFVLPERKASIRDMIGKITLSKVMGGKRVVKFGSGIHQFELF